MRKAHLVERVTVGGASLSRAGLGDGGVHDEESGEKSVWMVVVGGQSSDGALHAS